MKINNKVIALVDIILGVLFVISPLIYPLFVLPSVTKMYTEFSMTTKPSFTFTYIILGVIVLMGIVNLFFGFKIFTSKEKKYLTQGVYSAIITFILSSILMAVAMMPVISSIYSAIPQP